MPQTHEVFLMFPIKITRLFFVEGFIYSILKVTPFFCGPMGYVFRYKEGPNANNASKQVMHIGFEWCTRKLVVWTEQGRHGYCTVLHCKSFFALFTTNGVVQQLLLDKKVQQLLLAMISSLGSSSKAMSMAIASAKLGISLCNSSLIACHNMLEWFGLFVGFFVGFNGLMVDPISMQHEYRLTQK